MAIYGIADLHLSLGTQNKEMDIFGGIWENHTQKLYNTWQNTVKSDDVVVIAGDISWAMGLENSYSDLKFINELNGYKIILKGNHDYWWSTRNKLEQFVRDNNFLSIDFLHNNAFYVQDTLICGTRGWIIPDERTNSEDIKIFEREKQRLELSLKQAKNIDKDAPIIVIMHYPPVIEDSHNTAFLELMNSYGVKDCYYGHLHASAHKRAVTGQQDSINLHLISCDYVNFTPILIKSG